MKANNTGINEQYWNLLKEILSSFIKERAIKVYLFGSRAKGTAKESSDIDLALDAKGQKLPAGFIAEIKYAFQESDIPYIVDVIDLNDISESFRNAIKDDLAEIKSAKKTVRN